VRNAVKHAPDGSAVDIKASLRSGQAQIDILDNGGGVAADELDRIFEPFTRGRNAVGAGHGLGLAIARRAIQAHGGQISAQNTVAGGLCVSIKLPNCVKLPLTLSHLPPGSP
ncbi:MAG: sensor histidine kinase, partial [Rhodoferax sp.]|uniref:sensor histidine kinase n=1 Tax=Rhodoferax sp. TaxID=50421 RepID=UPI001B6A4856